MDKTKHLPIPNGKLNKVELIHGIILYSLL